MFALLAVVCIAAPVFAETPEEGEASNPLELQRDESLETPQAVAAREDSEYAYADLTAEGEASLLQDRFAAQLQAIDADPARALADVTIERLDSPTQALVTLDGEKALLESEVPLRAPEEDGDLHKVELGLEETPAGYEPANPLVDLTLPDSAEDAIGIGDEGLAITPVGTGASAATPLGEEDLLLPAAHEDTSFLLSPIAGGLELSAMLASRNSPQELAFNLNLPQGGSLRASEAGGAEVVGAGGEPIATITAPYAVDAQGTEVPAALAVAGNTLTILVPHRELDVAYPLFVDPEITENWSGFADPSKLGYWHWSWGGVAGAEDYIGRTSCIVTDACWGNGLYVRARSNFTYPAGSWGRWWFTPQGSTTYMRRVILGPIHFNAHGCWANEPHAYVGVWNDYSGWVVLGNMYPTGGMTGVDVDNLPPGSRTAFVGFHASSNSNLSCGRDYHLGGATLVLDDPENPSAGATSGYPTGWVKSGASFTINAPASDPGLGLKKATLYPAQTVTQVKELGCDGHYSNPCPGNYTFQFPMGAGSFDEGEKEVKFSVEDILGKPSNTYAWNMKVDRTPPEIELAGQLAQATDETEGDGKDDKDKPLPLPVYNLTVNATDGVLNPSNGGQKRSGVKKIQVFIDNGYTPVQTWEASSCSAGNCPLSKVFTLKLNELSADTQHYLRILATDFAGNAPRERKLEFEYIPATGMKDEYVQQYFPLPDGSGNEAEEEHPSRPELVVNLVSGNLLYRQQDLDVSGAAADLELELFYNSLLPEQQNTEWGDGWTLAQTPELEIEDPGAGAPSEATIVDESAMVESKVDLPANTGEEEFDKRLQATVEKVAGGYEITDESGETGETVSFDSSGRAEKVTNGTAATVEYDYEEGDLSAITIEDPGTANADPETIEEGEPGPPLQFLHSTNFGTRGSEDGQLKSPADVASDKDGNLFVLDRGNSRIEKYSPDGTFLAKFGSAGTGDGQLNYPSAIALDAAGNVLVAENHRVQKLSPSGEFLAKFGSIGSGDGQFLTGPTGIAVAGDGSIWVSNLSKVQRFSATGQFIERIGASGEGQINGAEGLATAPGGEVLAVDPGGDRVMAYDPEGDFLRQFGQSGTGPGQLATPVEVSVDAEGQVWIADSQTDRIQVFSADGDYLAGFGGPGEGAGQLDLEARSGIAVQLGRVWVADPGNDRISRWAYTRIADFLHSTNFGTRGSEDGQLKSPADVASDDEGNLWVLDGGNGRVQKFGPDGQFLAKWGAPGSAEGQLNNPSAIAIDAAGNILVADSFRVQKFSPTGDLLLKFGSLGAGGGQFLSNPTSLAVGTDGSIWASDTGRIYRYSSSGQFLERIATSGPGQSSYCESIAVGPGGEVFIADPGQDKIKVFDQEGDFLRQFGTSGTGPGQLAAPVEVSVDAEGQVWIADSQTDRVQVFSAEGDYLAGFGGPGEGAEQLDLAAKSGIAAELGRVWVTDGGNDRIGEWLGGIYEPSEEPVLTEDDPQLEVEVSDGLVETVEGEESGTIEYEHDGDLLSAVEGPDGEAQFSYDSAGRMTKVSLPNGTYGEIAYEATYGRVKSVKVAVEGKNPKTTYFSWSDEPHRTTVTPPDAPATTYDIGADGSIFKWWNAKEPPVFDDIGGTLYDPNNRETSTPIPTGVHNLVIQAHDEEGVASIRVIANNNQLVDEHTCAYDPEKPAECVTETNEWVTETGNWPPGIVYLEIIATDRLGEASSQRFWVNIPYTPPPDPEADEPPRFSDVLRFREEFGLDLDLKGDELAINDRVFESIGDWHNPLTPAGEIARATNEKWGVPLRAVDVAELEYRQSYVDQASMHLRQWVSGAGAANTYAGYYVDDRAGGIIRVGFTNNQENLVNLLKSEMSFLPSERVQPFPVQPAHSLGALEVLANDLRSRRVGQPAITGIAVDARANAIQVGASNVSAVESLVNGWYGLSAPVNVRYLASADGPKDVRERLSGPLRGGDRLVDDAWECTLGFGAREPTGQKSNGEVVVTYFALTAAHCFETLNEPVYRTGKDDEGKYKEVRIGNMVRTGFGQVFNGYGTDGQAIKLKEPGLVPKWLQVESFYTQKIHGAVPMKENMIVCTTGITSRTASCGRVRTFEEVEYDGSVMWQFNVGAAGPAGNSGGPVWELATGAAVGLTSSGPDGPAEWKETNVTPLLPVPNAPNNGIPGILAAPGMGALSIVEAK